MGNRGKVCLLLSLFWSVAMAQEEFTLEDLNFGGVNYEKYVPENKTLLWWGEKAVQVDATECSAADKTKGGRRTLFTLDEINTALSSQPELSAMSSLRGISFPYPDKSLCLARLGSIRFLYDFKTREVVWSVELESAANIDWQPDSRATAFVKDSQLWIAAGDGSRFKITSDGDERNIIYGRSVHRDEFGIRKGTYWSPKGNKLAFYRMDQSMVADYPLVDIPTADGGIASFAPEKYPMAGGVSHKVSIGVFDMRTKETIYLATADPTDRYFTNIAWSPDESAIYVFELNREQTDCRLMAYDSATGALLEQLYRETDDKYVEPLNPIEFLPWDSGQFVFQSRRDGFNHLYLFDTRSHDLTQLTCGAWEVMEFIGFNEKSKSLIYASNEASNMQRNTWKVDVATHARTPLDNGLGWHRAELSPSGNFIVDNWSEPNVPRKINITSVRTGRSANYFVADDPWAGHVAPVFSCGELLAADDSTLLNYRMVFPSDFDAAKRYPVVVYVYGGPHAHCVDAGWHYSSRSWETYMAQKGYILFVLDNRGGENRGKAFEQATFHRLGQEEMLDQMRGVDFLKSLPYVDAERIGVHGWSFGGYMTISLMTHYPDVFKVGVAGGPVIDWRWYEVMYGERYMGTPQSNPDGYEQTSLIRRAKDLKGKLQIIIGYNDNTVVPQHALSFIAECIREGTQPDFFLYPGETHNMLGHASVHLHERITQYFEDYLKACRPK